MPNSCSFASTRAGCPSVGGSCANPYPTLVQAQDLALALALALARGVHGGDQEPTPPANSEAFKDEKGDLLLIVIVGLVGFWAWWEAFTSGL
jgi:hypothetical protein